MVNLKLVLLHIAVVLAFAPHSSAMSTVLARLGHQISPQRISGDTIANDLYPFRSMWQASLEVTAGGPVTAPRVEFQSSGTFTDISPEPTRIDPGPTYVWDYPGQTMAVGERPLFFDVREAPLLSQPGLTATRAVDAPLLTSDSVIQTVNFTVRFDEPLPAGVDNIYVGVGTFGSDQTMVEEVVMLQNALPGWSHASSTSGNAGWYAGSITVGAEYDFQAQILCAKAPGYGGQTIYHKPSTFVTYADLYNPPDHTGTWTANVHPLGNTATYHVAETVNWDRMTTANRQDAGFGTVSLVVDDAGLQVDAVELVFGKSYDGEDNLDRYSFSINVEGKNTVAGTVTTPTGRVWSLDPGGGGTGPGHGL